MRTILTYQLLRSHMKKTVMLAGRHGCGFADECPVHDLERDLFVSALARPTATCYPIFRLARMRSPLPAAIPNMPRSTPVPVKADRVPMTDVCDLPAPHRTSGTVRWKFAVFSKWVCRHRYGDRLSGTAPVLMDRSQTGCPFIYHKNGSVMTYSDREAGTMTYPHNNGHQHISMAGILHAAHREPYRSESAQLADCRQRFQTRFCLLDLSNCNSSNGHCRDSLNNIPHQHQPAQLRTPVAASMVVRIRFRVSPPATSIFIPRRWTAWDQHSAGTCNGNYWIVVIDPNNNFQELRENNNVIAVPITLTRQTAPGTGVATISSNRAGVIAPGDVATLTANAGTASHLVHGCNNTVDPGQHRPAPIA